MNFKNHFKSMLLAVMAIAATTACEKEVLPEEPETPEVPTEDVLTVEPSGKMFFKAAGNEPVTLKVTTNVDKWTYEATEWLKAEQTENELVITAPDNMTTNRRMGRVTIMAGKAKPVKINVQQEPAAEEGPILSLFAVNGEKIKAAGKYGLNVKLSKVADEATTVTIKYNPDYLAEYNSKNGTEAALLPGAAVDFYGYDKILIPAGRKEGAPIEADIKFNVKEIEVGKQYIVPFVIDQVSNEGVFLPEENKTMVMTYLKESLHDMRNVAIFEINSENPLNALEYELEDGSNFFDAVVLFSANINYNEKEDFVFMHKNPSVSEILDQHETYIKPLRDKHIKVYLSILGNWDIAGVCQLSDWGAAEFAKEVAQACHDFELDGVMLDDEYSGFPPTDNKWFTTPGPGAGARLCYELKKALKAECPWPTEVSYYQLGTFNNTLPETVRDTETNVEHKINEFVDIIFPNYGTGPYYYFGGLEPSDCARYSINCTSGQGIFSASDLQRAMSEGYGWIMWYALNPVPDAEENLRSMHNLDQMKMMAPIMFGSELKEPTGYYKKAVKGENGGFDPKRYEFN